MYKRISAAIIATVMITAVFASLATVGGSHTSSAKWKSTGNTKITVDNGESMVLTVTVTNDSGDGIDNIRIVAPNAGWGPFPTVVAPKDNILDNIHPDNEVLLPKGTLVQLGAADLGIPENTELIIQAGNEIWLRPEQYDEQSELVDNLRVKITETTYDRNADTVGQIHRFTLTTAGNENYRTTQTNTTVNVDNCVLRLLSDTQVVRPGDNATIVFTSDATLELVSPLTTVTTSNITADNEIKLENDITQAINGTDNEEAVDAWTPGAGTANDNLARIYRAIAGASTNTTHNVISGDNVLLGDDNNLTIPANTKVILETDEVATLFDNTQLTAADMSHASMDNIKHAKNQPSDKWSSNSGANNPLPSGPYAAWTGVGDNVLASGDSLDFPLALTTPAAGDNYTVYVRTTDTSNDTKQTELTLEVDNVDPTVSISTSPMWAKDNTDVTITVTASESLAKLDNVMVAEGTVENVPVTVTPDADNKVWTGTYTTVDNAQRDGEAIITVVGAEFEDSVGNTGANTTDNFGIDRKVPYTPRPNEFANWPTDETPIGAPVGELQTDDGSYHLENEAYDNYGSGTGARKRLVSGTVKITVNGTTQDVSASSLGYWDHDLSLTEGVNTIGVKFVDRAGNESAENTENVTYDDTAPSITMDTVAGTSYSKGMYIGDNTPKFVITISDSVIGVENKGFKKTDNSGFSVMLYENNHPGGASDLGIDNLVNTVAWNRNTLTFENTIVDNTLLGDGHTYNVLVQAGDNLQFDNQIFSFNVDVSAPTPSVTNDVSLVDAETRTSITSPTDEKDLRVDWQNAEVGSTVKLYSNGTVIASGTADSNGEATLTFTMSEGEDKKLYIQEIDRAGNQSSKEYWQTLTVDATKPTVKLTAPEDGTSTSDSSITVSGTVTDKISDWDELTVSIDATGAIVMKSPPLNEDGSFSTTVPLEEGNNVITVVASDGAGNQSPASDAQVSVERTVTPWTMYAMIVAIVVVILAAIAVLRRS